MFTHFDRIHERDRQTDRQTQHDGIGRTCIASRGKKTDTETANLIPCHTNVWRVKTEVRRHRVKPPHLRAYPGCRCVTGAARGDRSVPGGVPRRPDATSNVARVRHRDH